MKWRARECGVRTANSPDCIQESENRITCCTMKTSSLIISTSLLFFCALYAQERTYPAAGNIIRRDGKPDCVQITDDNRAMAQAVQKARKTQDKFISALRSPMANQIRFAVKKPFIEGDKVEHIWVNELRFDGQLLHGKVDNEPVDLKGVRLGDAVSVKPEEISDWMYVQDGRLVGGYTVRCVSRDLPRQQRKQFEKAAGCRID
jgi:uncharacterized protein YegJ (DUF2314 family)